MDISTREKDKVLIFDIKGDLDAKSASLLKERMFLGNHLSEKTDKLNPYYS